MSEQVIDVVDKNVDTKSKTNTRVWKYGVGWGLPLGYLVGIDLSPSTTPFQNQAAIAALVLSGVFFALFLRELFRNRL